MVPIWVANIYHHLTPHTHTPYLDFAAVRFTSIAPNTEPDTFVTVTVTQLVHPSLNNKPPPTFLIYSLRFKIIVFLEISISDYIRSKMSESTL